MHILLVIMKSSSQLGGGGLWDDRTVNQTTFSNFKITRHKATDAVHMRETEQYITRYAPLFSADFQRFLKVDDCYLALFPYTTYSQPVIQVSSVVDRRNLCRKYSLIHCRSSFEYWDFCDPSLISTQHTRIFADSIGALRRKYPDLPAKKYHTLTVHSVGAIYDGTPIDSYPIETIIILPDGIFRLYTGPEDYYMHKSGETAKYNLASDPIYRCTGHRPFVPSRKPVATYSPSRSCCAIDQYGTVYPPLPHNMCGNEETYVPPKIYEQDQRTEAGGCVLS